ncbi:uncharacterized protein LOC115626141 [Scaptodrosophila lebanonensis]|uniref:Uncharacterized protein LOC115626141 n=1 Tax=Drosophila lebanonensis TaxID=7225 RepID=A0A6J2TQ81_DROLE|nr:uncharacterized protein LOC115626141 [Scaptodrosophila lebanonensis]
MFRTKQLEPAKDDERNKAEVRANLVVFAVLCAVIRIVPFVINKLSS